MRYPGRAQHTPPQGAGVGHAHQSPNGSWDCARSSTSFLRLARRAWVGVRGWEAPDETLGAGGIPLSPPAEVDDVPVGASVGTAPTPRLSSGEGAAEDAPSGQIEERRDLHEWARASLTSPVVSQETHSAARPGYPYSPSPTGWLLE